MAKMTAVIWLWKLAILRLSLDLFQVAAGGYIAAMSGQHWRELDVDYRLCLILGLCIQMAACIRSFTDKTAAKIASGSNLPPDSGDTVLISRTTRSATTLTPAVAATRESPATPETIATTDTVTTVTTPKKDA